MGSFRNFLCLPLTHICTDICTYKSVCVSAHALIEQRNKLKKGKIDHSFGNGE